MRRKMIRRRVMETILSSVIIAMLVLQYLLITAKIDKLTKEFKEKEDELDI